MTTESAHAVPCRTIRSGGMGAKECHHGAVWENRRRRAEWDYFRHEAPRGAMSGHEWSAAGRRHGFMRPGRLPGLGWNGQRFGESARWPVSRVLYPAPKGRRWPFVWDAGCPDASRDQPERRRGNALDPRPSHCGDGGRAAPIRSCSRWGLPCRPRCRVRGALLPHPFTLTCVETPAVCFLWHCP